MKKISLSFCLALAAGAANATPGMPHIMAVAPGEFYGTAAIMEEVDLASFVVADPGASCANNFAELPVSYNAEAISLRVGIHDYILLPAGIDGFANTLSFSDVEGCEALDMSKLTAMRTVWQHKLLPFVQQVMDWTVATDVVTFRSPMFPVPNAVGYVVKKH